MVNRQIVNSPTLPEVAPLINWTYFFRAWRVPGRYEGIDQVCQCPACRAAWLQGFAEADRPRAEEALALLRDAQEMLRHFRDTPDVRLRAVARLLAARSTGEDIIITDEDGRETPLPMLRQQRPSADGCCYSLADFVHPGGDRIGLFACTVQGADALADTFNRQGDPYRALLAQTLADRLAEATSEWLHYQVRTRLWGYHPHEPFDPDKLRRGQYPGIRPAVGYPALPDQSLIFDLDRLLHLGGIGIALTESGAMHPASSVCGLYLSHPQARYFLVGPVDAAQLADYARRRGRTPDEMSRWLACGNAEG